MNAPTACPPCAGHDPRGATTQADIAGPIADPTRAPSNAYDPALDTPGPVADASSLGAIGQGLVRPECVLATCHGDIYCADWRGGVAHLRPDGTQTLYHGRMPDGSDPKPNGIALLANGDFLFAHLGAEAGGVFRLARDGTITPWLTACEGHPLPPTNFVLPDSAGRTWITVSTRRTPRARGYRADCADGFIVCVQPDGRARIAADGLGYANEVAVHPDGRWLYVNETFARRLSRFALHADGTLGTRETVAQFGPGDFPDGLALDEDGHAWVVSVVSNRLIRVAPDGSRTLWLQDCDPAHLAWVEAAYANGTMERTHLDGIRSQRLRNISSIAFAGPDRRTALLGCLLGDSLHSLRLPAAGQRPTHWNHP